MDSEDRDRHTEDAADRIYRGLVTEGFLPVLIAGERLGTSYRSPRIKLGRLPQTRADQAEEVAQQLAMQMGYRVRLEEDYSDYWYHEWTDDWPDQDDPDIKYEVAFEDEGEGIWR